MFLRVERGSSIPISRQIAEQIRAQCLSGVVKPGDSLPSVRQLAQQLAVNVNTVFRVYERLAADKLIEMRHGDGTYVLPPPAAANQRLNEQCTQYKREFEALVRRGLLLGLEPAELRRMLSAAVASERGRQREETAAITSSEELVAAHSSESRASRTTTTKGAP